MIEECDRLLRLADSPRGNHLSVTMMCGVRFASEANQMDQMNTVALP
jgi:hypothetical protein